MLSLVSLVRGRDTQNEWIGPRFSYVQDGELLKGRSGSFSENLLVL